MPSRPTSPRKAPLPGETLRRFVASTLNAAGVGDTDAGSEREIEFIASTAETDRYGDQIIQEGWRLDAYRTNPTLLWSHDYSLPPVGRVTEVEVRGGQLVARAKLLSAGISKLADELWGAIKEGALRSVSVGFSVGNEADYEPIRTADGDFGGYRYLRPELLEISLVAVGANASALLSRGLVPTNDKDYDMENQEPVPAAAAPAPIPRAEPDPPPTNLRRVAGTAARPSDSLSPDIVRAFSATGARANFAAIGSMADVARLRSIVNTTGAVAVPVGTTTSVVPADIRPTLLLDLIPFEPRGPGKIHVSVIGYGTNRAAIVAEGALKPQSDFSVTPKELSPVKVAHWTCVTDEELEDIPALRGVIDQELIIGLLQKVDSEVVLARIIADATAFVPGAGSSLIDNAVAMLAQLTAQGETGARVIANPMDLAATLTAKNSTGDYLVYPPQILAAISASPTVPAGKLLGFAPRGVQGFERAGETVVMGLKNDDLIKNQKTILAEWRGNVAIVIPSIVLYGDATAALAARERTSR